MATRAGIAIYASRRAARIGYDARVRDTITDNRGERKQAGFSLVGYDYSGERSLHENALFWQHQHAKRIWTDAKLPEPESEKPGIRIQCDGVGQRAYAEEI